MSHALTRLALAGLLLCAAAQGQQQQSAKEICPTIIVDCPSDVSKPGELRTFTATVTGAATAKLSYAWAISGGTIRSGQGTPTIQVEVEGLSGLTGTVTVTGVPESCVSSASCTTSICSGFILSRLYDRYGKLRWAEERKRLDSFADELQHQPGAQGYVVVSPGPKETEQSALRRAARAQSYLVNTRGIDAGRIVMGAGEAREALTVELWIVPAGATPPPLKAR